MFDLLQWQEIAMLSLPRKAAIASCISTTFRGHFCLGANDIARNRSRAIFLQSMRRHFLLVKHRPWHAERLLLHVWYIKSVIAHLDCFRCSFSSPARKKGGGRGGGQGLEMRNDVLTT